MNRYPIFRIGLFLVIASQTQAGVKCPPVFGSHMVLQRDQQSPVWGTADSGEKITVDFANTKMETTAAADGRWQVPFT